MEDYNFLESGSHADQENPNVRIDKWLWAARFFKTRALAIQGVDIGKVLVNGERVKPAKNVHVGDILTVRRGPYVSIIVVKALSLRRGPAAEAQNLFEETSESIAGRQATADRLAREPQQDMHGRPTKRARRQINRFTERY